MGYAEDKWLKEFDEKSPKFKWFWIAYGFDWDYLIELRKQEKIPWMIHLMNDVWYILPDNEFNIIKNPPGWKEFLDLLEEL